MSNITSVSFATYNILNPFHAVKWGDKPGLNEKGLSLSQAELKASTETEDENAWRVYSNWDQRCPKVASNIQLADVVCLQEVSRETLETLQQLTQGYQLAKAAYHTSANQEHGNAILFNPESISLNRSFELIHGTEESHRAAACAIFDIGEKVVEVASVHLRGYWSHQPDLEKKQQSKVEGFEELQTYATGLEKDLERIDGIVIGGDFNEDPIEKKQDLYRPGFLKANGYLFDGNLAVTEPVNNRRIDWIGYKPLTSIEKVTLTPMDLEKTHKIASDHLMTGTVIEWSA